MSVVKKSYAHATKFSVKVFISKNKDSSLTRKLLFEFKIILFPKASKGLDKRILKHEHYKTTFILYLKHFLKKYHKSTNFLVRKIQTERENKIACEKKRACAYAIKARKHKKRKRK